MAEILTIYDDVAALTERVAALEAQLAAMPTTSVIELTANTDLNTLGVGKYYIPNTEIAATITNKPITTNQNAFIYVTYGANNELQQWFFINTKNVNLNNKIYYRYYYDNEWCEWNTGYLREDDTGWLNLPLASGVGQHNSTDFPCQYRKIANKVYVRGCVNGFTEVEKLITTLPVGFRPSKTFYKLGATNGGNTDTFNVRANGTITRISTTLPNLATTNYHFINMEFLID